MLDSSEGEISDCSSIEENPNDVTVVNQKVPTSLQPMPRKRKRAEKNVTSNGNKVKCRESKTKSNGQLTARTSYTVASIVSTWDDTTEFGISFRNMNAEEQEAEVKRLNTVALKCQKNTVKSKVLTLKYKSMVAERMRTYLNESRSPLTSIYHVVDKTKECSASQS